MKYAYNILVNFRNELINFYEWEKADKIKSLKKVPLIKVSDDLLKEIINKNIKLKRTTLNQIEIDKEYNCIFATDYDSICVNFNEKGEIKKLSKLTLEDENDILEYIFKLKIVPFEYEITNKNNFTYSPLTRSEQNIIKSIKKELEKLKGKKETINFLCSEWFDESNNINYSYDKLIEDISKSYSSHHEEFYKLIKLITCKNA